MADDPSTEPTPPVDDPPEPGKGAPAGKSGGEDDLDALRKQVSDLEADRDHWKSTSRKHEDQAKKNRDDARAKQTVEEQLEGLRRDIADRDAADIASRAEMAAEKLHAKLVRGSLSDDDATALVGLIDPTRLLVDGKPDPGEIDKVAKSLTKTVARPAPDPDQGRRGGAPPRDMNQLFRDAARGGVTR